MIPGLAAADVDYRLLPGTDTVAPGRLATYRFRIDGRDGPVTDFDIEHTKPMHLIVVRRDFAGFKHLHPEMGADGTWSTPLTVPDPGVYRVFADFVVDGVKQTLATDLFVAGDFQPQPLPQPSRVADAGDGYTVEVIGQPIAGQESTLQFAVSRHGRVVTDVPTYLGARGHLVALRCDTGSTPNRPPPGSTVRDGCLPTERGSPSTRMPSPKRSNASPAAPACR
jgi:hypothetical protein